jgi:hypothetical protein
MHGINLFLALEGQEYVWEKLWLEMGVSQEGDIHQKQNKKNSF